MVIDDEWMGDGYIKDKPAASTIGIPLEDRIKDKVISLQDQLIQNAYSGPEGPKLNDNDVLRYSAMVEVLKAMLQ